MIDRLAQYPPRNWTAEYQARLNVALESRFVDTGKSVPWIIKSALYMFNVVVPGNSLVQLIKKAGPNSTETQAAAKQMLDQAELHDVNSEQVACAIMLMVIARDEPPYNLRNFVSALRDHRVGQRLEWQDIIQAFDRDALVVTKEQFKRIFDALHPLAQAIHGLDLQPLWGGNWKHAPTQLTFVAAFLSHDSGELDASQIPTLRPAYSLEDFEDASAEVQEYARDAVKHPYVSLDAITALLRLAFEDHDAYTLALQNLTIERVVNTNLALFVGSASAVETRWSQVQDMAIKTLFEKILVTVARGLDADATRDVNFALHLLWRHHKSWVANNIYKHYQKWPLQLNTILEVAHHHSMLLDLIAAKNELSLDLAALAHGRNLFDLGDWLHQISAEMPSETITPALCQFLAGKIQDDIAAHKEGQDPQTVPLRARTAYTILSFLVQNLQEVERIELQRTAINAYPRLINYDQGFDDIIDANNVNGNALSPEADAKMQDYFRMMWNGEKGVQDIIGVLRRLKYSQDAADQDLFACMVFGLFDEYHCFAQYPQKALADTALLFGSIIDMKLLSNIALQVAISMVLEAVREYHPDDLMFKFGLQALVRFQGRLEEWTRLCETLLEIPGLKDTEIYPVLEEVTRRRQEGAEEGDEPKINGDAADNFLAPEPGVPEFTCVSVDPIPPDEPSEDPEDALQGEMLFILNNMDPKTFAYRIDELKSKVKPEYHQWLAKSLVESRIKSQPNLHPLYMALLHDFDEPTLWAAVLRNTYACIIKMLNAETTMGSVNERTLLKNLAAWLASTTLTCNQSIKHRNISFRDLLIEAKDTQRLLVVIPFTCKILSYVAQSAVFRPPCAWTMEIVEILIELYLFADLKLNLKFEIEVLCKTLSLDHTEIEPAVVIRSRPSLDQELMSSDVFNELTLAESLLTSNRRLASRFETSFSSQELLSLLKHNYPAPPGSPSDQDRIRSLLTDATERAVSDIIGAVVERSVTIAAIAACQITMKDLALESDSNKLRDSAHTAVRSLAGSLAAVTCKEPLRNSMVSNIHNLRPQIPEQLLPSGYMQMFVSDNLDNVCAVVERTAADASVEEIDVQLEEAGAFRERGAPDFAQSSQISQWANFIPAPFKISPRGLTREQLEIYEEFDRTTRGAQNHAMNAAQDSSRQLPDMLQDQFVPSFPTAEPTGNHTLGQSRFGDLSQAQVHVNGYADGPSPEERIPDAVGDLLHAAKAAAADQDNADQLLHAQSVKQACNTLIEVLQSAAVGEPEKNSWLIAARALVNIVFSGYESPRVLEILSAVLGFICARLDTPEITKEIVMHWCNDLDDARLFKTPVTAALIKAGLMDVRRLDNIIASALTEQDRPDTFAFFNDLLDKTLLLPHPIVLRADFANSITALSDCIAKGHNMGQARDTIERLGGTSVLSNTFGNGIDKSDDMQMAYVFEEWVRFSENIDKPFVVASFMQQLQVQQILTNHEKLACFLKVSIQACVKACEHEEAQPVPNFEKQLTKPDALAHLVLLMVESQPKTHGSMKAIKLKYLETSLTIIIMLFAQCVKQAHGPWSQRPFFRFFSTLIINLQPVDTHGLGEDELPLVSVARSLLLLSPNKFPVLSFAWLSLVSHRTLMPALIRDCGQTGRDLYSQLISAQIEYTGELVQSLDPGMAGKDLIRGTLKLLLVIHHDFPDFVADYAFQLLRNVPTICSQMRGLITSASPSTLSDLPEPFIEGLKIERLPDAKYAPRIMGDFYQPIAVANLEGTLASFYEKPTSSGSSIEIILEALTSPSRDSTFVAAINADLATSLLINLPQRTLDTQPFLFFSEDSPTVILLTSLIQRLDWEPRYHFLSSMANHLRFPNSFTAFYSQMFIHFFRTNELEAQVQLDIQQQVLRVLMERIVANRPHSWGLIVTLVELLKNGNYKLFELPFVKETPEVSLSRASYNQLVADNRQVERMLASLLQQMAQAQRPAA